MTRLQTSEAEVNRFSRRTPETSEKCIRSCRSGGHRAIHYYQKACQPENIN